jgi:hypothetical protein
MRTIQQLPIVKEVNGDFPFGAILNETDTSDGTPVVREIYNDPLVNIYKLLQVVGITASGNEDSETNGYQLIEALKKLPNSLNDIEQVLTLNVLQWQCNFNLDLLPNKYFFFAKASDNYENGASYTFKGTTATTYPFTSTGFSISDELLIIIDSATVKAYSLTSINSTSEEVFTVLGSPLSFNDSNFMYYQEAGNILTDLPSVDYLENIARVDSSDGTLLINDIFITQGHVLCFCYSVANDEYSFRQFSLTDLSESDLVDSGSIFGTGTDLMPYVFLSTDRSVWVTNNANNDVDDYSLVKLAYDSTAKTMTVISNISIDNTYIKTSNTVILGNVLATFVDGNLEKYDLSTGVKNPVIQTYNGLNGQVFGFNGNIFFTSGEVAKKWTI